MLSYLFTDCSFNDWPDLSTTMTNSVRERQILPAVHTSFMNKVGSVSFIPICDKQLTPGVASRSHFRPLLISYLLLLFEIGHRFTYTHEGLFDILHRGCIGYPYVLVIPESLAMNERNLCLLKKIEGKIERRFYEPRP